MKKKQYKAPVVTKVKLEIKHAVLGTCNTSIINIDKGVLGCKVSHCYN